ncbi:MAG: DUF4870 domain-containing protein [Verrucomicrobiota bacterium]
MDDPKPDTPPETPETPSSSDTPPAAPEDPPAAPEAAPEVPPAAPEAATDASQQTAEAPPQETPVDLGEVSDDDKTMGLLAHILGILTGFVGPLIIWLVKKDQSKFVDFHGKEALNFQITLTIAYVVSGVLMMVCIGYLTFVAAWICALVFGIQGAMAANERKPYTYPLTLRLVK